ncbi:hypothetical protein [Aquibacillus sediminis]|uniref:hypothetical protein n=1 Tax=Aquibacillus sediminis TaxID=2574734 RepID=UPI001107D974|nr:hypothetical protein [Aquibacillus sediminis]
MIKKWVFSTLYCFIFIIIAYLIGISISSYTIYSIQNILFVEGIMLLLIGLMASMETSHTGIRMEAIGQEQDQYMQHKNMEVTGIERNSTGYYKHFLKHSVTEFAFDTVTIISTGSIIIFFTLLLG